MTNDEIQQVASEILSKNLGHFGFQGAETAPEIDFDGSSVLRIKARYTDENAPTKAITQSMHEIRSALLGQGEERFVYLEGVLLGEEHIDEDIN